MNSNLPDEPTEPDSPNDNKTVLTVKQIKKILLQTTYDVLSNDDAESLEKMFIFMLNKIQQLEHKITLIERQNLQNH